MYIKASVLFRCDKNGCDESFNATVDNSNAGRESVPIRNDQFTAESILPLCWSYVIRAKTLHITHYCPSHNPK